MEKVFYRLLMLSAVNAWIIYTKLHRNSKKTFFQFLVELAEQLIEEGRSKAVVKRRSYSGRRPKRVKLIKDVGMHLPVSGKTRRCNGCTKKGKEKRKILCAECDLPYCMDWIASDSVILKLFQQTKRDDFKLQLIQLCTFLIGIQKFVPVYWNRYVPALVSIGTYIVPASFSPFYTMFVFHLVVCENVRILK